MLGNWWSTKVQSTRGRKRESVHKCNICDKTFKILQTPNQHKIQQHSDQVFVCKGCGKKFKTNNSMNRHKKIMCVRPCHMNKFCNFSKRGKGHSVKTIKEIKEIILKLKVMGWRRGRGWFWPFSGISQTFSTTLIVYLLRDLYKKELYKINGQLLKKLYEKGFILPELSFCRLLLPKWFSLYGFELPSDQNKKN